MTPRMVYCPLCARTLVADLTKPAKRLVAECDCGEVFEIATDPWGKGIDLHRITERCWNVRKLAAQKAAKRLKEADA